MAKKNENIKIGNKNIINKSNIGHFNNYKEKDSLLSMFSKWVFGILATVIAGVILGWLLYLLNLK